MTGVYERRHAPGAVAQAFADHENTLPPGKEQHAHEALRRLWRRRPPRVRRGPPLTVNTVELKAEAACAACNVSFLTGVTNLDVRGLERSALTLPTSVVELTLNHQTKRVTVSGTENVTSLGVRNPNVTLSPCRSWRR